MNTQIAAPADTRVLEILDEYLAERVAGRTPDRDALLARHPELAESLEASFRALDFVHDAGRTLAASEEAPGREEPAALGRVLGDYRILREIARGGMAVVYEAEQVSLGRRVALKVLPFAAVLDSKQLQRFKNEAQAAAQIQHPHIVPVYAVGCDRGVHYYAMQYVDGQSLAVAIRDIKEGRSGTGQKTPISSHGSNREPAFIRMAVALGVQAAQALDHAHQVGIVHRDVKPGNLLVDLGGTLWVTDFGLAHSHKDVGLTMTGELLGTIRYMSPEQALAKAAPVDHRTDVYSLGATLYELFTLEPAFPGDDPVQLLKDIGSKEPTPLRRLNPALPRDVETVLLKAMSKDPAGRYATAQEMARDLERFLENRPIEAKRPGVLRRVAKWARRHRILVGAAAGMLVLALAGLATGIALLWREQERTRTAFGRAEANLTLALKALDEIYLDESAGSPQIREGLPRDLLQRGLGFYEQFATENAHDKDIAWLVGGAYTRASIIFRALDQKVQAEQALGRAISAGREAIRLQPDSAKSYVSLGNARWIQGDLDGAIQAYEEAIGRQPDYAGAHINLGIALLKKGNTEGAIEQFRVAIHLMPGDANAHNELGMALLKIRNRGGAIEQYNEAIRLKSDFAPAYTNLGNALRENDELDAAIRAYARVTELRPNSAIGHLNFGHALRDKSDLKGAIREYSEAIRCQPNGAVAHWFLGVTFRENGELERSIQETREAIRVRPRDPLNHLMNSHMLEGSVPLPVPVPKGISGPASAAAEAPRGDPIEGYEDASAFPKAVVHATGSTTQLGPFTFTMPHVVEVATGFATGTFELVTANGDKLVGTITGVAAPPDNTPTVMFIVETATITGGTGRFDGATGGFTIERFYDRDSGKTAGTFAGDISAPDLRK